MDKKVKKAIELVQGGYSMKEASLAVGRSRNWLWVRMQSHPGIRRALKPWIKIGRPKRR